MPPYLAVLQDLSFYRLLRAIDREIAERCRAARCPVCGGRLHSARFERKPRGLPVPLADDQHTTRFSFCCAVDGCRKRVTPPSVRFFGRKVYPASIFVVVSALCNGVGTAQRRLAEMLNVSRRTVGRWRNWWHGSFAATPFWKQASAAFPMPLDFARLPDALIERFAGTDRQRLFAVLRFLLPLTGGFRSGHAF